MTFRCKYLVEDYVKGYTAYARRSSRRWLTRILWTMAILILAIGLLGSLGPRPSSWSPLPLYFLAAFWFYYAITVWKRAGGRAFAGRPELAQEYTVDFDENGVAFAGPISQTRWTWPAFIKFVEAEKVFLVHLSPCAFVILPKRLLTNEQADQLRAMLMQKLPAK
jgi:hypothetical protein